MAFTRRGSRRDRLQFLPYELFFKQAVHSPPITGDSTQMWRSLRAGLLAKRRRHSAQCAAAGAFRLQSRRSQIHGKFDHSGLQSSMNETIVIIDDDLELSRILERLLRAEGWVAYSAPTASEGERLLALHQPALLLLDLMLPDVNGLRLCQRWRVKYPSLGILMLSARGELTDKVLGLELGADDYVAKPFERRELVARIRAVLRRRETNVKLLARLDFGRLEIDLIRREALVDGKAMLLTSMEYRILVALAFAAGKTLSREELTQAAQPGNYRPMDRTVDVQVGRLRRKLETVLPEEACINTVRGEGYCFTPPSA